MMPVVNLLNMWKEEVRIMLEEEWRSWKQQEEENGEAQAPKEGKSEGGLD